VFFGPVDSEALLRFAAIFLSLIIFSPLIVILFFYRLCIHYFLRAASKACQNRAVNLFSQACSRT